MLIVSFLQPSNLLERGEGTIKYRIFLLEGKTTP